MGFPSTVGFRGLVEYKFLKFIVDSGTKKHLTLSRQPKRLTQKQNQKSMSHGIVKPIDKLFSTQSAEWHGLADVVTEITTETVKPILPPILRGGMSLDLGLPGEFTKPELKKRVSDFL